MEETTNTAPSAPSEPVAQPASELVAPSEPPPSLTARNTPDEAPRAELPTPPKGKPPVEPPPGRRFGHDDKDLKQMANALKTARPQPKAAPQPPPKPIDVGLTMSDYYKSPDADAREVLTALRNASGNHHDRLVDAVVAEYGDQIRKELSLSRPAHISNEDMYRIPSGLRDAASQLTEDEWREVSLASPEFQMKALRTVMERNQLRQQVEQMEIEHHNMRVQVAIDSATRDAETLSAKYDKQHNDRLERWEPTNDATLNAEIRQNVLHSAMYAATQTPQFAEAFNECIGAFRFAAWHRAMGDTEAADFYDGHAKQLAQDWNNEFSVSLNKRIAAVERLLGADRQKIDEEEVRPASQPRPKVALKSEKVKTPVKTLPKPGAQFLSGGFGLSQARIEELTADLQRRTQRRGNA